MNQLRWHPLLSQWVVVSTHRQGRPQMPADWCPFCPGSGHVPDHYDVFLYRNDFPALSPLADPYKPYDGGLYEATGARGACDVILYSPNHTLRPSQLTVENWLKVVDLWTSRTAAHEGNPDIATIAIFENCGEAVGVTMPHPHGQIYAMSFVTPLMERELEASKHYAKAQDGACIFCDLLAEELRQEERIVASNDSFVAFVPYAARFPAEISLYARRHTSTLLDLSTAERADLASILSLIRRKYDSLYGFLMPLMMCVKQAPFRETAATTPYHFHVQFLPLQRSATKLKYLAAIETGFGTFLADTLPEEMAAKLRDVIV